MNDRTYLTMEEYKKIEDMVAVFPSISKKEARERYLNPLKFACNCLRDEISGGAHNILGGIAGLALNASGNGDTDFLKTEMYKLKRFVKEE